MPSFALTVTHTLFALSERTAPRIAGRLAFRLFERTPNPRRPSARERASLARSAPLMEEGRLHRLRISKGWIAAHVFKPVGAMQQAAPSMIGPPGDEAAPRRSEPTALVIHGWHSRSEHMMPIVTQLRAAGFRVIAIDLPGHGQSSGRALNMAIAVETCVEAEKWFGPFEVVVGHSFGGAVAMSALSGSVRQFAPLDAERLVLIAAPNSMPDYFAWFARLLRLGKRTRASLEQVVENLTGNKLAEFVGARQLATIGVPTLVLHAPDDTDVSPDNARALSGAGEHVLLNWVEGAGHRRILGDPASLEAISEFVGNPGAAHLMLPEERTPLTAA